MTQDADDPRFKFGLRFSLLARRWRQVLDRQLVAAGLTDATWAPLVHLRESGDGITQKELAARVGVDGSSLVRVLDILMRRGLIERRPDAHDGRARRIVLTPAGEDEVVRIRTTLSRIEAQLLADLSDAEIAVVLQAFSRIDVRLDALAAGAGQAQRP